MASSFLCLFVAFLSSRSPSISLLHLEKASSKAVLCFWHSSSMRCFNSFFVAMTFASASFALLNPCLYCRIEILLGELSHFYLSYDNFIIPILLFFRLPKTRSTTKASLFFRSVITLMLLYRLPCLFSVKVIISVFIFR